ncbi:MAG: hypothetical protein ACYDCK_09685 [Thermoplasmatota archaeon]
MFVRATLGALVLALVVAIPFSPSPASARAETFVAGAASVDITPPPVSDASDAAFVPQCGATLDAMRALWPGARDYAFEEPYVDAQGFGRFVVGDPFCDANANGRYDAPWVAGGSGADKWPAATDAANPVSAQAIVVGARASEASARDSGEKIAMVVVDSIGIMKPTIDAIRHEAMERAPDLADVFVSSTHDESAPDPIGLWGPDGSEAPQDPQGVLTTVPAMSGVDEYYMQFLVDRVAGAVAAADARAEPAMLKLAMANQPPNVESCWSSYPYIDDQRMPVMQAADAATGRVVFTLVNVNTHAETLAFSHVDAYTHLFSADWPGQMRASLEARWPGSVGVELAGLVGSVETPSVYEPASAQVANVPGLKHDVPGNPNGCTSVYGEPANATPVSDAYAFLAAYGGAVADTAANALAASGEVAPVGSIRSARENVCVPLENVEFVAGFAAGIFAERPAYADPTCSVGFQREAGPAAVLLTRPGTPRGPNPAWVGTSVAVVRIGSAEFVYSPGEVFPTTEMRGAMNASLMPFPTDCYDAQTGNFSCGAPLPMTPWTLAEMHAPYKFMAGLGEDMIGYLFPPGNFVGDDVESDENPWLAYHASMPGDRDRFGNGHPDDSESVGPYAGLAVSNAISHLLAREGPGSDVTPGVFIDAAGRTSASPFVSASFGGAVGVRTSAGETYVVGENARSFATFDGWADSGTAGTTLPYSVSSAGIVREDGRVLLIDVFAGSG